ncbi:hypothetical protein [Streptomyces sp. Tue6028]|uniref:hypothetical protein n=1 Tax=Streptomyces sp. Tue6028 TaxID=2036037 RepID=UPI003D72DD54
MRQFKAPSDVDGRVRPGGGTRHPKRLTLVLESKTYVHLGHREQWRGAKDFTFAYARKADGFPRGRSSRCSQIGRSCR